jgi:Ca2+/Na+ antiporter
MKKMLERIHFLALGLALGIFVCGINLPGTNAESVGLSFMTIVLVTDIFFLIRKKKFKNEESILLRTVFLYIFSGMSIASVISLVLGWTTVISSIILLLLTLVLWLKFSVKSW